MSIQEIATKAVTGDKVAQAVWSSLSTGDIIRAMKAELEQKIGNIHITQIQELAQVSAEEALELYSVIESEALLDWSEATKREIRMMISYAQQFIANGRCWK